MVTGYARSSRVYEDLATGRLKSAIIADGAETVIEYAEAKHTSSFPGRDLKRKVSIGFVDEDIRVIP